MDDRVQVDIVGITMNPSSGGSYALLIKEVGGKRHLPIIIGAYEAQSIALEMEGIKPPRPLTHDLIKKIIDTLGYEIVDVTISELHEGTFFATITLDDYQIDSRPSDAIALAVRCGVAIYVSEKVMQEASFIPESEIQNEPTYHTDIHPTEKGRRLENLRNRLKEAVDREDYEIAAKIRDEIRKLEASD